MKILFLTMVGITNLNRRGIYEDLINELVDRGHEVYLVAPVERRLNLFTRLNKYGNATILNVKTLNLSQTSIIEKGIGQVLIEGQYLRAIKKYLKGIHFDLILYSTPPVTFSKVIKYIKKRDNAYTYLLLKDIFPQNALDMGLMTKGSWLHRYFEGKEKRLYSISDTIGCMSEANKTFILKQNPEIPESKVEVNPNSIKPNYISYSDSEKAAIRILYEIPINKKVFIYGGNLGLPQGIDFLIETMDRITTPEAHFVVVGKGTQYKKLANWFEKNNPKQSTLLSGLPKHEYDMLLAACDVGMIFLDKRFTIPNFPSRLLSYLEMKKPVLAVTDVNTDIGQIIETAGCGYWVEANKLDEVQKKINQLCQDDLNAMGEKGWDLLQRDFLVSRSCELIEEKVKS